MTYNNVDPSEIVATAAELNAVEPVLPLAQAEHDALEPALNASTSADQIALFIGEATERVEAFQAHHKETTDGHKANVKALAETGHGIVHDNLAQAYGVAQFLMENPLVLSALLKKHAIEIRINANPYGPIVKMLFGQWKEFTAKERLTAKAQASHKAFRPVDPNRTDGTYIGFRENRSAEKYAKALRHAASKNWSVNDLRDKLATMKLAGIMKADTAANAEPITQEVLNRRQAVRNQTPCHILSADTLGIKAENKREYAAVWGFVRNGKFEIMGVYPTKEEQIEAHVMDLVKAQGAQLNQDQIADELRAAPDAGAENA